MSNLFSNVEFVEAVISVVAVLVGALWSAGKSSELYTKIKDRKWIVALQAVEAGVEHSYRTYVGEKKKAREDGKLTQEEVELARKIALNAAKQFAKTQGIDILKTLGEEYLEYWVTQAVLDAKDTS